MHVNKLNVAIINFFFLFFLNKKLNILLTCATYCIHNLNDKHRKIIRTNRMEHIAEFYFDIYFWRIFNSGTTSFCPTWKRTIPPTMEERGGQETRRLSLGSRRIARRGSCRPSTMTSDDKIHIRLSLVPPAINNETLSRVIKT